VRIAKARSLKRAKAALARKLAVLPHRLWIDGSNFRRRKAVGFEARLVDKEDE
jgi:transposase